MEQFEHEISPCDTQGYYYDGVGQAASSPGQLVTECSEIDDRAVFSVLQFGAIVPPLSPWTGIHRFIPGYRYRGVNAVGPVEPEQHDISSLDPEGQADEVERLLDRSLQQHLGEESDPVLLFSGGVDSGLIASRLAALGYQNSLLVNFCFGDADPESRQAEAMAGQLGLQFERVIARRAPCSCLAEPGQIYPQPFGDHSTLPSAELAHAVVSKLAENKRVIIDGTGADGAFGMSSKINLWTRIGRTPVAARRMASFLYGKGLWQHESRVEYAARILRRSIEMPELSAIIAQNPLAGVFYDTAHRETVDRLLDSWVAGWAGSFPAQRVVAADLALTCANIFAQKTRAILESAGHRVVFPFLDVEMVSTALSSIPRWQMDEPKAPLKRSLARHVSREMVFRPKSGFVDIKGAVFFDGLFIEYLRAAIEPTGPIHHLLYTKPLLKACDLLVQRKVLPAQTLNLLWAVAFTDRWYRTAQI